MSIEKAKELINECIVFTKDESIIEVIEQALSELEQAEAENKQLKEKYEQLESHAAKFGYTI